MPYGSISISLKKKNNRQHLPPNTTRFNTKPPRNCSEILTTTRVQFSEDPEDPIRCNAESFAVGDKHQLHLEIHQGQIEVIASWEDVAGRKHEGQIGWVPGLNASKIFALITDGPLGATIRSISVPLNGKGLKIRIAVWTLG